MRLCWRRLVTLASNRTESNVNDDLKRLVHDRLSSEGLLQKNWCGLVLAACDGRDAVESVLRNATTAPTVATPGAAKRHAGAYLTALSVQGFRGIGPKQTLAFTPGPGLTIVVGRNGSGKSSFAEALEVLFTGDSKRWSDRSKIWKEGWRNLHQTTSAGIELDLLLEEQGSAKITCVWDDGAALEAQKVVVQPKGKSKTSLEGMGWKAALISYRPFLSYNELGSMLDEGPSKLYDALSLVLGLEDLVVAQAALAKSRLERQQATDTADLGREALVELLKALLGKEADDAATACLDALTSKSWGLDVLEALTAFGAMPAADQDISILTRALSLDSGDAERVSAAAAALRDADQKLKAAAGGDAETSRQLALLLEAALVFHAGHGDIDCPVCGKKAGLTPAWAQSSQKEIVRLRGIASGSDQAHGAADEARRRARELLTAPPRLLTQLFEIGLDGLADAREQWDGWHAGSSINDLTGLATHLETRHEAFAKAIDVLKKAAAAELKRREDRWRPIAAAIAEWIQGARDARAGAEHLPRIKAAETWLKDAAAEIRNQRFAPIADKAMAMWEYLRQQSNVTLGRIELAGAKSQRRVTLDVTVDGIPGAALGVMSQGELHSLALSLFLPRATLSESPFRFVVIDDPVQSMDPARVDGLARALEDTALTRQVIVFTHDERLPEAVRRLNIKSTILSITRRPKSIVEVRTALDPIRAHIEDALALVHTTDLPKDVLRSLVPGFCRSALEASFIGVVRRRRLAAGRQHSDVEEDLRDAGKLTGLAALALFDDKDRGSDVMKRLNQFGSWAGDVFKQSKDGVHEAVGGDLKLMIRDAEKLAAKIVELR
jgi:ABC-type Mn2+/Zn2+ transport system ATPase subunit